MKKPLFIIVSLLSLASIYSCNKGNDISNEDIQKKKISDIIPQEYLDSLKKIGLEINAGTTPPNVEGVYEIKPHILDTSNFDDLYSPGYRFSDALLKLSDQSNSDYSINLIGTNFLKNRDTSIATAISGNGNNFTVYGKVKASNDYNNAYVIAAIVLSGTIENNSIKNCKTGIICIDDSQSDGTFLKKGQGRIAYDSDKTSEKVADDAVSSNKKTSTINSVGGRSILQK